MSRSAPKNQAKLQRPLRDSQFRVSVGLMEDAESNPEPNGKARAAAPNSEQSIPGDVALDWGGAWGKQGTAKATIADASNLNQGAMTQGTGNQRTGSTEENSADPLAWPEIPLPKRNGKGVPRLVTEEVTEETTADAPVKLPHPPLEESPGEDHALAKAEDPDEMALHNLFAEMFEDLRHQARMTMGGANPNHTLQPTALIGEAFIRINKAGPTKWKSKEHFIRVASKTIRHVLVDYFRSKHTLKRGKKRDFIELDLIAETFEERAIDLEALDLALDRLEKMDPQMAEAVQMHFFGGMKMEDVAKVIGIPKRTLERRWKMVRLWLRTQIND